MREINKIIVHCADTRTSQDFDISDIKRWHTDPKPKGNGSYAYKGKKYKQKSDLPEKVRGREGNGWSDVGYHYYIKLNGQLQLGRPIERSGAHTYKHNNDSIGICFEGGKTPDGGKWNAPTPEQFNCFKDLKEYLFRVFGDLPIKGHYQYSNKTCPNFDIGIL
jgi:N-acetylmuramoyl-L-alanine amidase